MLSENIYAFAGYATIFTFGYFFVLHDNINEIRVTNILKLTKMLFRVTIPAFHYSDFPSSEFCVMYCYNYLLVYRFIVAHKVNAVFDGKHITACMVCPCIPGFRITLNV